jgi:hypothetical protein
MKINYENRNVVYNTQVCRILWKRKQNYWNIYNLQIPMSSNELKEEFYLIYLKTDKIE